jgi:cellulose synthase operon protein B
MKSKRSTVRNFIFALGLIFLGSTFAGAKDGIVQAQAEETPSPELMHEVESDLVHQVTLADLGYAEPILLQGPFASSQVNFGLASNIVLLEGAELRISYSSYISSLLPAQGDESHTGSLAGTLRLIFNGVELNPIIIKGDGAGSALLQIPDNALTTDPESGTHELVFSWDASASCDFNLATIITIDAQSSFSLPAESGNLQTDLLQFPAPFYLPNNPFPIGLSIIVPDMPAEFELSAALKIAAGFGEFTQGELGISLTPFSLLSETQLHNNHLILVAGQASMPQFKGESIHSDLENLASVVPQGDGLLAELQSPWNPERAVLVISGENAQAVEQAARALISGSLQTTENPGIAFVHPKLQDTSPSTHETTISLDGLGNKDLIFETRGVETREIEFFANPAAVNAADAYLDLVLSHSNLIDYLQSGMTVQLNDLPIGTIRFNDSSAARGIHRMNIPPGSLHTGINKLQIQGELSPRSPCSNPGSGNIWVRIFSDSVLHLPPAAGFSANNEGFTLGEFPWSFDERNQSINSIVILSSADPVVWDVAAQLAYQIGKNYHQSVWHPGVVYAENYPETDLADNLIVIGRLGKLPDLETLTRNLPAPFSNAGESIPSGTSETSFAIRAGSEVGILQMGGASQVRDGNLTLTILGGTEAGLRQAVETLVDPHSYDLLSNANYALIQKNHIQKKYIPINQVEDEEEDFAEDINPPETMPEEVQMPDPPVREQAGWILPALILIILAILLLTVMEVRTWMSKRANS